MNTQQTALWEAYLRAEGRAPREQKLTAFGTFLDALTASPASDWHSWARDIARRVADDGENFVIRMPLFERAVLPAPFASHRAGLPGCARWLAGLAQHLYRSRACLEQLPPGEQTELGLLRTAVRQDPGDPASRRRLIKCLASLLRYSLHELPAGVLYGMDGATPDECLELERELDEFWELVVGTNDEPTCRELVEQCRLHFPAYRDFLLKREAYTSYEDYLTRAVAGGRR